MKTIFEHIEHVKGKPHHIRKRVAFAVAGVATGLIALVWLVGSIGTGAFALGNSSFADSASPTPVQTTESTNTSGLAGAAAALPPQSVDVPVHIEIVDTTPAAAKQKPVEQTTLPF